MSLGFDREDRKWAQFFRQISLPEKRINQTFRSEIPAHLPAALNQLQVLFHHKRLRNCLVGVADSQEIFARVER